MQCSDLERYLEAFLDLRLGRSRGAILRRHLSACVHCRARVEHLRSFERDLQRSFRAMERAQSVWTGLEPDLVRSGGLAEGPPVLPFLGPAEPPRRSSALTETVGRRPARSTAARPEVEAARTRLRQARSRRWGQRTAGLLLLLAASVGAGLLMWRAWSGGGAAEPDLSAYAELHGSDVAVQFASNNPDDLRRWMAPWLGEDLPALPSPTGFNLVGASIDERAETTRAVVVYRREGEATLLLIWPRPDDRAAATPVASNADGMSQLRWTHAGFAFAVVSPLPEADLLPFTWGASQPL